MQAAKEAFSEEWMEVTKRQDRRQSRTWDFPQDIPSS